MCSILLALSYFFSLEYSSYVVMCWLAPINVDSFHQVPDHSQGVLPPTLQSADVHHLLSVSAVVFALHCAQQSRFQNGGNHSSVTEPVNRPIGFLLATIYFYQMHLFSSFHGPNATLSVGGEDTRDRRLLPRFRPNAR